MKVRQKNRLSQLFVLTVVMALSVFLPASKGISAEKLNLVVMDPLCAPLACECVQGYAQRRYEVLGKYLEKKLGVKIKVVFDPSLTNVLKEKTVSKADIIIGKHSVIESDAKINQLSLTPIASLTDKEGLTTQYGMLVVWKKDPAQSVSDLKDYRVLLGPKDSVEKHGAALDLLKVNKVPAPADIEICTACSDSACKIVELKKGEKAVATISSYAKPLLEGCGTIKKGDLRVVGKTKPVPFITVFLRSSLPADQQNMIKKALMVSGENNKLCEALESSYGFIEYTVPKTKKSASKKKLKK
jgi:ABC-type phosphate/phosphonate transport system substrate-binding protein